MGYSIRKISDEDREWVRYVFINHWGDEFSISKGNKFYADQLPGYIAEDSTNKIGLITFNISDDGCEIVTLNSFAEVQGIGTSLIERVKQDAKEEGCKRLWLITTNDNTHALRFYQKRDFTIKAVYINAMEESRKLKPGIPILGNDDIPIRDEIELELLF